MKFMSAMAFVLATSVAAPAALAHGNMAPKHGGVVQMSGETLFELVRTGTGVSIYVTDDDEALPASTASGSVAVSAGGKSRTVPLRAGPGNRFDAPGLKLVKGDRVAVQVVPKATQARLGTVFVIK